MINPFEADRMKERFLKGVKHRFYPNDKTLSDKELEIETLLAYDALEFYSKYECLGAKQIVQLWDGIILGLELARGRLESLQELYYGMRYEEYYLRTYRFFVRTFIINKYIGEIKYAD